MSLILFSIFIFFVTPASFLWWYANHLSDYWERKKVPFVPSSLCTHVKSLFRDPVAPLEKYKRIYEATAGFNYAGCFLRLRPQLMVRDPHLVREILVTDFENFRDRGNVIFDKREPITNHLFSAPGPLWKQLRVRLTPTFTSGKIKYMFGLIQECAVEYQQVLSKHAESGQLFDAKDYSVNYTIEVISSTAFGLKTHSMNTDTEFKEMTYRIFAPTFMRRLKFALEGWCPVVKNLVHLRIFDEHITNFFFQTVREVVAYRKLTKHSRNDFLQILMTLNEKSVADGSDEPDGAERKVGEEKLEFTTELMTAQCFLFFIAGFDTSSFILSTTLLELAMNEAVQSKLHEEIDFYLEQQDNNNIVTYEMIQSMPYLHKVVQEAMRKYPIFPHLSRVAARAYRMPGSDLMIDPGTEVIIPIAGLHHDPQYFPDPEKFDPERFTDEEIKARHNFVFLPFGGGPRNCIGSRFALISVKLGVVYLLQKYKLSVTPETIYPLKYKSYKIISDVDHKILLKCSLRSH